MTPWRPKVGVGQRMSDKQVDWLHRKRAPELAVRIKDYWWNRHRIVVDTTLIKEPHGHDEIWVIRSNVPAIFK